MAVYTCILNQLIFSCPEIGHYRLLSNSFFSSSHGGFSIKFGILSTCLKAEFEWNGDPRRGLGDYRIPKTFLTRLNGSKIPVDEIAPYKGILR